MSSNPFGPGNPELNPYHHSGGGDIPPVRGDETRTHYELEEACLLADYLADLPLPYRTVTSCESKTVAMLRASLAAGCDPSALGVAETYIPDLSARGIHDAYRKRSCMFKRLEGPSFVKRLQDIGTLSSKEATVYYGGVQFQHTWHADEQWVTVECIDTSDAPISPGNFTEMQRWQLWAPGERSLFCNHSMPTIRTKNSDGSHEIRVIDPAYTRRPVPLETWRSQQNFTEGIILTGDIDSEKPNLYMHSELLTDRQYERLCGIISDVTGSELLPDKKALGEYIQNLTIDAYAAIMDTFFNLQHEEEEVPINMQWGLYDSWEYSLSLAKKVRSGRGHLPSLPDLYDESGVHKTIGSLAKLFLYEMWLTATDPYANA